MKESLMLYLTRFAIGIALLVLLTGSHALASASTESQGDEIAGVELGTSPSCPLLKISGVTVKKARVYGHQQDLIKFLDKVGATAGKFFLNCTDCPCIIESRLPGACLYRSSPKAAWGGGNIPPGSIIVMIDDGGEFINVYKATHQDSSCLTGEICINTKGEISFSVKCDDTGITVSTSGEVSLSLTGGGVSVSVPLKKGKP
jgi:hypothetical protein